MCVYSIYIYIHIHTLHAYRISTYYIFTVFPTNNKNPLLLPCVQRQPLPLHLGRCRTPLRRHAFHGRRGEGFRLCLSAPSSLARRSAPRR